MELQPPPRARPAGPRGDFEGSPVGLRRLIRHPLAHGRAEHRKESDAQNRRMQSRSSFKE